MCRPHFDDYLKDCFILQNLGSTNPFVSSPDLHGNYPHVYFEQSSPNFKVFKGNYMTTDPVYGMRPMTSQEKKAMDQWTAEFTHDMDEFADDMSSHLADENTLDASDDLKDQLKDQLDAMSDDLDSDNSDDEWESAFNAKMDKFVNEIKEKKSELKEKTLAKLKKKAQKLLKRKQKKHEKMKKKLQKKMAKMHEHKKAAKAQEDKHSLLEHVKGKVDEHSMLEHIKDSLKDWWNTKPEDDFKTLEAEPWKGRDSDFTDMEGQVFGDLDLGKGRTDIYSPTDDLIVGNVSNDQAGAVVNIGLLI